MRGAYLASQQVLGALLALLGVAMVVSAVARGGGPLAFGVVLGLLFVVVGAARVWLVRGREPEGE